MIKNWNEFNEALKFDTHAVKKGPSNSDSFQMEGDIVKDLSIDGERAGYIHFRIKGDILDLVQLDIREKFRGSGYGNEIMEEVIREAKERNLKHIKLEVLNNNIRAINLYKKFGFKVDKEGMFLEMILDLK